MTAVSAAGAGKSITSLLGAQPAADAQALRLSQSALWERQRRFYEARAPEIWGTATVPHSITCNPRIAGTYARLALEFLRAAGADLHASPADATDVPHIVELGGGSGRFAHLFIGHLTALAPGLRFVYVLTDFSPGRVASWAAHPSFGPLVEQGLLDFAVLDAESPGPLELTISGRSLAAGCLRAPVVGIANYLFDTLPQDGYLIRAGELLEARVVLGSEAAQDAVPRVDWQAAPCGPIPDDVRGVLEQYTEMLDDTTVLVPVGAMECLTFLSDLTAAPSCAFVADKGHSTPVELCSNQEPSFVFHGTCFSLMVNFDFLARWVRGRGDLAILPRDPARSLVVAAFVAGRLDHPHLFEAWVQDQLLDTGPDNFFTVRPLLSAAQSIEPMLAALRLSRFDPVLLIELLPALLEVLPGVPDSMRSEVDRVLQRVWENYFPIGEPIDMALCVGLAYSAMAYFAEAVDFLSRSVKENPDSAPAAFAMSVARRGVRDLGAALEWADRALQLQPTFSEARALRAVLTEELGSGSVR